MTLPSGRNFVLSRQTNEGTLSAVITSIGAGLRSLKVGEVEMIQDYATEAATPLCAGVVMAPWTNRLDAGRWTYQDKVREFKINIPEQNNANHGMLLETDYEVLAQGEDSITLGAKIAATEFYPFEVQTSVTYELCDNGITVTHSAENFSKDPAPYAVGSHPYFKFSLANTDDLFLKLAASTVTLVDDRQIPIGELPTANSKYDLRAGRRVADLDLDENFTDLEFDEAGKAHTYLLTAEGKGLDIWQDSHFKNVVLFTPDFFPSADGPVWAVAIEPSTTAPNAFNTLEDLQWLNAGQVFTARWGVVFTL